MPISGFSGIGDRLTTALVSGDFDLYCEVIELPLTIVPMGESPYILSDETALRRDFLLYHSVQKRHGVTNIFREACSLTPHFDWTLGGTGPRQDFLKH